MPAKINPIYRPAVARSFLSKSISVFTVTTTGVNIFASTGATGAIDAILKSLSNNATIVAISDITNASPSVFTVWLEGEFPTDTYDGVNSETFAKHLQDTIQALGTVDTRNLATTAVAAGPVYKADQI
jgi:hypothetical protein